MIEINSLSASRIVMKLAVSAEEMNKYKQEALRSLGQNVKVEGFREGKAPENILEENIGKEKWLIETIDVAVNNKYYQAVMEIKDKYLVVGQPKIEFKSKIDFDSIDKGLEFTAEVDIYPEVVLPDFAKIEVKAEKIEISDEDFQKSRDAFLKKRATLKEMEPEYKAIKGDWIDIDFEVEVDQQKIADAGTKRFPLVIGNNIMMTGFEDQLIGHAAGDKFDFVLEVGEEYRDKRLAGKKVIFYILVNEIKQLIIPEFNDDFVASLGLDDIKNTEEFKKYWFDSTKVQKERDLDEKIKSDILGEIEKNTTIEVPASMIEQELNMMWHEFEHNLKDRGIATADYLKRENLEANKVKEGWRDQAVKRVKYGLIIRKIIKRDDIKVEEKEVDEVLGQRLDAIEKDFVKNKVENIDQKINDYKQKIFSSDYRKQVEQEMIIDKMFAHLKTLMLKK